MEWCLRHFVARGDTSPNRPCRFHATPLSRKSVRRAIGTAHQCAERHSLGTLDDNRPSCTLRKSGFILSVLCKFATGKAGEEPLGHIHLTVDENGMPKDPKKRLAIGLGTGFAAVTIRVWLVWRPQHPSGFWC